MSKTAGWEDFPEYDKISVMINEKRKEIMDNEELHSLLISEGNFSGAEASETRHTQLCNEMDILLAKRRCFHDL